MPDAQAEEMLGVEDGDDVTPKLTPEEKETQQYLESLEPPRGEAETKPPKKEEEAPAEEETRSEESKEVEEEVSGKEAPEEERPGVDERLLERAKEATFTKEEAEALGADGLRMVLGAFDRSLIASIPREEQPEREVTTKPVAEKKPDAGEEALEIPDLDPEEYDKGVVDAFKAVKGENTTLRERLSMVEELLVRRDMESEAREFDKWIVGLDGYKEVFGEGPVEKLADQNAKDERFKVYDQMKALQEAYRQRGATIPEAGELWDRALNSLHGQRAEQMAAKKLNERLKDRAGKFIRKPQTREQPDERTPDQKAMAALKTKMAEMGGTDEDEW